MTWYYEGEPLEKVPEGYQGFVYEIKSLVDGRRYFGKKNFWFVKTKQLKGKKKRVKVESDWKDYYGSSEELKSDVAKHGVDKFQRTVLYLCKTKGMMSYLELKMQMINEVLEKPEDFYNAQIHCRIHRSHVKL